MTEAPQAARIASQRSHHGDLFVDHYEWLREKDETAVREHLDAENAYTQQKTAHLEPLTEEIFEEIRSRTKETDMSVPSRRDGWWYYVRTQKDAQYSRLVRRPVTDPDDWTPPPIDVTGHESEQLLLDGNVEAEGHEFFSLGSMSLSDDHNFLAWSRDVTGDERYDLRIRDLRTGKDLPEVISDIGAGSTWSADGRYLFYVRVDAAWRPFQVWRHKIGSSEPDVCVFEEPDERFFLSIGRTDTEKYLVVSLGSKVTTEQWVLDASDPTGEFRLIWPRREGIEYSIEDAVIDGRETLLILHNKNNANFELAIAPWDDPAELRTILRGDSRTRLDGASVHQRHLLISIRLDGLPQSGTMSLAGSEPGPLEIIDLGEELVGTALSITDSKAPLVRLGVASFIRPGRIFDFDPVTREMTLLKEGEVLGDFTPDDYVSERLWVRAQDGVDIPVSVIRRRSTKIDGSAPLWLYGYGSYEISIDPSFSIPRLSLLDRGFIVAIAHVRGGGELGHEWYESGKKEFKQNSFNDFVSVARFLVQEKWTSPDRLIAEGGSAGGLLVGAAMNIAPELFAGVLADVPFVDPLTSILDPSLPLTVIEWDEWGNPLDDKAAYEYIKAYSPYENIRPVPYPSVLAQTSLNDTRVLYVEPAKWVAALRHTTTGSAPILLRTNTSAGHGGASGRYSTWRERAQELAWIIDVASGGPLSRSD